MIKVFIHYLTIVPTLLLLVIISIASFSSVVFAQKIKVVTEYLEPYQVENDDGSLGGFSTEVVQALFKITGDTPDILVVPWARAYAIGKIEPNVMIYSIAHTKQRDTLFSWIGNLKEERLFFWGLKKNLPDNIQAVKDISELKAYRVAASRNSNVAQFLQENDFDYVSELIKEDQNMLMLFSQRVDLIVATELTLKNRTNKLGFDFYELVKIKEVTSLNNNLSIAFNKDSDPAVIKQYQQAFSQLKSNGELAKIKQAWRIN